MANIQPPIALEDIVLTLPQGFWPLAPGWWFIIVLSITVLTWSGYKFYQQRQRLAFYRKQTKTLDLIEKYIRKNEISELEVFKILSRIFKLFLIHYSHNKNVAALTGEQLKRWTENKISIPAELSCLFDDSIFKQDPQLQQLDKNQLLSSVAVFKTTISQLQQHFKISAGDA